MSPKGPAAWETYEEVARDLLERISDHLGLDYVEGKQKLVGKLGLEREIDGKGVKKGDQGIVVIECRRYTTSRINMNDMGGIAFTIEDLGAEGILVSPMEPQKGAKVIAAAHGIQHVRLNPEATSTDYVLMLDFLNRAFIGVSETITAVDDARVVVQNEADREE